MKYWNAFLEELIQIKLASFATSQFSGPTGEGPRVARQVSAIPGFSRPGPSVKVAFQTSQFSGPLSMGSFKMTSPGPGFTMPGASRKDAPSVAPNVDPASTSPSVKYSAAGMGTSIAAISSPKRALSRTQQVGTSQFSPQEGTSIATFSRPNMVGKGSLVGPALPGATNRT